MELLARLGESYEEYQPYLNDVIARLRRVAIVFIVTLVVGFLCAAPIVRLLISWLDLTDVTIVVSSPFQLFNLSFSIACMIAAAVAVPHFIWNLYAFLRTGLTRKELISGLKIIPISILLFVAGAAFGALSLYWGLAIMAKQAALFGLQNFWDVGTFISQIITTASLLGIIFQFPIILGLLFRAGVLEYSHFAGKRPIVYASSLILVAILPPSDGLSLIIMTMPIIALYELTLVIYRRK